MRLRDPIDIDDTEAESRGWCMSLRADARAAGWFAEPAVLGRREEERWWIFRPTLDWWANNFRGGLVGISTCELVTGEWRVSVFGTDDDALVLDMPTQDDARRVALSLPTPITKSHLRAIGFVMG